MSTNPIRGEQELNLIPGRKTIWRASLDTLKRIEKATGKSIFVLLRDPTSVDLNTSMSIIMLGLADANLDPVDLATVQKKLWEAGLVPIFQTALKLLTVAAGGSEDQGLNPLMPEETIAG